MILGLVKIDEVSLYIVVLLAISAIQLFVDCKADQVRARMSLGFRGARFDV